MSTTINGSTGIDKVVPDTEVQQLGVNQTIQDMTASRAFATDYTNDTGKAIYIYVWQGVGNSCSIQLYIDGVQLSTQYSSSIAVENFLTAVIPNGSVYKITYTVGALTKWHELR